MRANGNRPQAVLKSVIAAGGLDQADDLAALLRQRITRLTQARSVGNRVPPAASHITGLIPEATGPMPADMQQALTELRHAIEDRASELARADVAAGATWTRGLGQPPVAAPLAARWWRAATTVAAYRDRYTVDSAHPIGPKADSIIQRIDQQRAAAALRSIQQLHRTGRRPPAEPGRAHARTRLARPVAARPPCRVRGLPGRLEGIR